MKINILKSAVAVFALTAAACTDNYLDINSHPYEPSESDMQTDGYILGSTLTSLAGTVVSTDVNTAQFTDVLLGGTVGGYYAPTKQSWTNTIANYNPTDDWTNVFMRSKEIIPTLYSNLRQLKKVTGDPILLAIADVIKVMAMHRVTDTYGPIPYSKIGENGQIQVAYDSQEEVYDAFFRELNSAIETLTAHRNEAISAKADYIYGGNPEKWCKLANSLKLRLAMRIVYAAPDKARQMAEEAVKSEVGVILSNADNAQLTSFGADGNPIWVAVNYNNEGSTTGGDTHVAADITAYMAGYADPRCAKYFISSEWEGQPYVGIRRGIVIPQTTVGFKYSGVNVGIASPVVWMNAAEVAFLRAEAKAVFGFDMGGATAEELYNEGIRLSFEQWGVSGAATYSDPAGTNSYAETLSTVTGAWNEAASVDEKQERILIQKWIANWGLGNEAWADYRRTGYPHLIPATADGNKSLGVVDSQLGARRMAYPSDEYTTNNENVLRAVTTLLGGNDNMATRLWWDCNPAIR